MMIGDMMGVMKFANNMTAPFTINPDTNNLKYQSSRQNTRFTGIHFDRLDYYMYLGNATHIGKFSVQVDSSKTTGVISGIAF